MRGGSRDGMDSADPPASSIVAIEAMVDDVSMTKITFRPDQAAVAAEMLDLDQSGAAHLQSVAPFDDHRALLGELLEAKVRELRELLDPVQVDLRQLHSTPADPDQLEGVDHHRPGR